MSERDDFHRIICDLFATEHYDGCLYKDNPRFPCQCGYYERKERYFKAVADAKAIAAANEAARSRPSPTR